MNNKKGYSVGENTEIAETAVIGNGCKIGNNVKIHHFVVIYDETEIGDGTEIFDHAVIGRPPKSSGNLVSKISDVQPPVVIGKNTVIGALAVIYSDCKIGNNVLIADGASMREGCILKDKALLAKYVTLNHHVVVGENSKIMDLTHITSRTEIEKDVFIAPGVMSANDNSMRIKGEPVTSKIVLHEGSKIGAGAVLLPDVKIGENAVVGAQALVTKSVADNIRVMGIPAKEK